MQKQDEMTKLSHCSWNTNGVV